MKFVLYVLIVFTFIRTVSYGLFELRENKNKPGAITIFGIALGTCILTSIMVYIR